MEQCHTRHRIRRIRGLNNVELFYFWYNNIDVIEPRAFSGFNELTDLEIWRNVIGTINTTAFTGMRNLTNLVIVGNNIGRLDYLAFSGLDSLETIKIEKNFIHTIGTWAFYGLDGLVELRLFNNSILIIEEGGLHLSGNSSTTLIQYLNSYGAKDPKAREAPSGVNIEGNVQYNVVVLENLFPPEIIEFFHNSRLIK